MQRWQLQEAKNRLSEVVDKAVHQGPQMITRRGVETAVVLSVENYREIRQPETSLVDFLLSAPRFDELDVERPKDTGRKIEL